MAIIDAKARIFLLLMLSCSTGWAIPPVVSLCGPGAFVGKGSSDSIGIIHRQESLSGCQLDFAYAWTRSPYCVYDYDGGKLNRPIKGTLSYVRFRPPQKESNTIFYVCVQEKPE